MYHICTEIGFGIWKDTFAMPNLQAHKTMNHNFLFFNVYFEILMKLNSRISNGWTEMETKY